MTSNLTEADVTRLLHDPSPETRAETAEKIAVSFERAKLNETERRIATDIFRVMARDVAVHVRETLSRNLKASDDLPHDLALVLARDVESVALPILEHSAVLTDEDLVDIVRGSSAEKQAAIARRASISAPVADALIDSRNESAVAHLVENAGAELSEKALQRVLDSYGEEDSVKGSMARRAKLPITVAERLVVMVSDNLRDYLVTHHELSPALATDLILESRERATVGLLPPAAEAPDIEKLVRQLKANGRLTPSIVLRALCVGDLAFFEASLAVLAKTPIVNAHTLIHDPGSLGLKSLYLRANLPERMYPAFRVAVDVARETEYDGGERDRERYVSRMIERILTQYENVGFDNLDYLLKKLKQLAA
jgi:uncharacterized protein (DUF2336 family)